MGPSADRELHLTIGSRFENIELVQMTVDEVLRERGVPEDLRHWIGLAVREAVANAIKHGNRLDPGKRVDIAVGLERDRVEIRVGDEGPGFDPDRVGDPLAPENRLRTDGRGIFYMRKFMDEVGYSFGPGGGTVVTLRKRLNSSPAAGPGREERGMT
ncbi:MAG: spoIIAB [Acidobacteria bacterium]|jgi:serine/threonine-protein kinase RsbW|nr:spoIIAB [Acidobacteriota bacterium]